jgi:hypothetical protein
VGQFKFSFQRLLQKRGCAIERIFKGLGSFDCSEQSTSLVCGEHLAQTSSFAFVSKIEFPFQKAIFTRNIAKVN